MDDQIRSIVREMPFKVVDSVDKDADTELASDTDVLADCCAKSPQDSPRLVDDTPDDLIIRSPATQVLLRAPVPAPLKELPRRERRVEFPSPQDDPQVLESRESGDQPRDGLIRRHSLAI